MKAKIVWATPDADKLIGYCARVSNPENQTNESVEGLLRYCGTHGHWSIFEMANACIEIEITRDIGRQILRHRSFSFQEFSQRYQSVEKLPKPELRECRLQDTKNRQNSIQIGQSADEVNVGLWWSEAQACLLADAEFLYKQSLAKGIAKEQARALLPEGLTMSRMYMNGTLRSWVHYLKQRLDPSTQKEHRELAQDILSELRHVAPITMSAFFPEIA